MVPGTWNSRCLGAVAGESMMCSRNKSKASRASCAEPVGERQVKAVQGLVGQFLS